jgi:hypothetical protein
MWLNDNDMTSEHDKSKDVVRVINIFSNITQTFEKVSTGNLMPFFHIQYNTIKQMTTSLLCLLIAMSTI